VIDSLRGGTVDAAYIIGVLSGLSTRPGAPRNPVATRCDSTSDIIIWILSSSQKPPVTPSSILISFIPDSGAERHEDSSRKGLRHRARLALDIARSLREAVGDRVKVTAQVASVIAVPPGSRAGFIHGSQLVIDGGADAVLRPTSF
jgi:hypothetical protein